MKYSWTLLLTLLIACTTNSDDPMENMKRDFDIYMQAFNTADYELMCDMLYPTYFDLFPRDKTIEELGELRKMYGPMTMPDYTLTGIMDPVAFNDTLYSIIDFDFDILQELNAYALNRKKYLVQQFKMTYKDKDLVFSEDSTSFTATDVSTMVAISVNGGGSWQFVDHKANDASGRFSARCISPAVYVVIMQKYKASVETH